MFLAPIFQVVCALLLAGTALSSTSSRCVRVLSELLSTHLPVMTQGGGAPSFREGEECYTGCCLLGTAVMCDTGGYFV
jgi:CDP-diglyceride synthetase